MTYGAEICTAKSAAFATSMVAGPVYNTYPLGEPPSVMLSICEPFCTCTVFAIGKLSLQVLKVRPREGCWPGRASCTS